MRFDPQQIQKTQMRMETNRSGFDTVRDEVAALVHPLTRGYTEQLSPGAEVTHWQYDDYAAQSREEGVAGFIGLFMPKGQLWQKLRMPDDAMMARVPIQQGLETIAKRLFRLRYDPESGFENMIVTGVNSMFTAGDQSSWADIRRDARGYDIGISYQSENVNGIFVERNAEGRVSRTHRKFCLTAEQALGKWGEKSPPKVKEAMEGTSPRPDEEFEFIHVIEPNREMKQGRIDAEGMPFKSCYYSCKDKLSFEEGGYWTMRRVISSFERITHENYGRSPFMRVLCSIRASQVIMQDRILAVEREVKPSWLAMDDELDSAILDLSPDGVTYGGLDERGNPTFRRAETSGNLQSAEALHAEFHEMIDRASYRYTFQLSREQKTHITATRTLEEIAEKGLLMGPLATMGGEWIAAMLPVEIDLMGQLGYLDDMPPEILDFIADGGRFECVFDNQLTRMLDTGEAVGYMRTAEQVAGLAQFDKKAAQIFKRAFPMERAILKLGEINGVGASWRATEEERQEAMDAEAQAAQQQQLLETAPVLASTARDLAGMGAQAGAMVQ
jgi:hypothetical protein